MKYHTEHIGRSILRQIISRKVIILMALALIFSLIIAAGPIVKADGEQNIHIYLGGSDPKDIDYSAIFVEKMPEPVRIVSDQLTIISDSGMITGAKAKITNTERPDFKVEALGIGTAVPGLETEYVAATGVLTITGRHTVADYEMALRSLTYFNSSDSPYIAEDRLVEVTVSDGQSVSPPAVSTVTIQPVNDAPELNPLCQIGVMTLTPINEDSAPTNGNSISTIIKSGEQDGRVCITDKDKSDPRGFAIIGINSSNGTWQYSINGGANWENFPAGVSQESAVLLSETARIRFIPKPNFFGPSQFDFKAWDQSGGRPNGSTGVNTSPGGGTTPFSKDAGTVTIQVISVNDLPVVDLNGPGDGIDYSTLHYAGGGEPVPIAASTATITDIDDSLLTRLTVTLTNPLDGDAERLKVELPPVSAISIDPYNGATGELVLRGEASPAEYEQALRKITYANASNTPTLEDRIVTVVARDRESNSVPARTTITVKRLNHAPVLDPEATLTLGDIAQNDTDPPGAQISEILAAAGDPITDIDPDSLRGIAVIGAGSSYGQWQYRIEEPVRMAAAGWQPIGTVSSASALLLGDDVWLRFVPASGYYGPIDPLVFRAWDRTSGQSGQANVDTSVNGGHAAFSTLTNEIGAEVIPPNYPPVLNLSGNEKDPNYATTFSINRGPISVATPSLVITDRDDDELRSASVQISNLRDGSAELLAADTRGTNITGRYSPETSTLILEGVDSLDNYQRVLRTVTYNNQLKEPDSDTRLIKFVLTDVREGKSSSRYTTVMFVAAPDVYFYIPVTAWDDLNDTCSRSVRVPLNTEQVFKLDKHESWYYFDLPSTTTATVELRDFRSMNGQIQIIRGQGCSNLQIIGYNGEQGLRPERTVELVSTPPGRYYIRIVIEDHTSSLPDYRLYIRTR